MFLVLCLRNPGEGGVVVVAALVFQGMIVCVSNKPQLHVFLFVKRVKCTIGPSTCERMSLRSINFEIAFLGP